MKKFKGRLDIMIMTHGQFALGKMMETLIDTFDSYLNINVRSCFHLISLATPFLKLSKGTVIAITSVEGKIAVKDSFMNSLTKSMLNSLIENSALELSGWGIRVNGVSPALTYTNHRVTEDFGEPENKDYLSKMGTFFPLNKEVYLSLNIGTLP